jgi:hypothetical protein
VGSLAEPGDYQVEQLRARVGVGDDDPDARQGGDEQGVPADLPPE